MSLAKRSLRLAAKKVGAVDGDVHHFHAPHAEGRGGHRGAGSPAAEDVTRLSERFHFAAARSANRPAPIGSATEAPNLSCRVLGAA